MQIDNTTAQTLVATSDLDRRAKHTFEITNSSGDDVYVWIDAGVSPPTKYAKRLSSGESSPFAIGGGNAGLLPIMVALVEGGTSATVEPVLMVVE